MRRVTHLDQLADKLCEERVRRVIEPMPAGTAPDSVPEDDIQYLLDLGLGLDSGWVRIFDRRSGQEPLAARLSDSEQRSASGRRVRLLRLYGDCRRASSVGAQSFAPRQCNPLRPYRLFGPALALR